MDSKLRGFVVIHDNGTLRGTIMPAFGKGVLELKLMHKENIPKKALFPMQWKRTPAPQITPQNCQDANGPEIWEIELKDIRVTQVKAKELGGHVPDEI